MSEAYQTWTPWSAACAPRSSRVGAVKGLLGGVLIASALCVFRAG
jgi:hypothetical protein